MAHFDALVSKLNHRLVSRINWSSEFDYIHRACVDCDSLLELLKCKSGESLDHLRLCCTFVWCQLQEVSNNSSRAEGTERAFSTVFTDCFIVA